LDVIGINVYGVKGVGKVKQAISYIKNHGKRTWIFEHDGYLKRKVKNTIYGLRIAIVKT